MVQSYARAKMRSRPQVHFFKIAHNFQTHTSFITFTSNYSQHRALNFGGNCVGVAGCGDGVTVADLSDARAQGSVTARAAGATVSFGLLGVKECGFGCATFTQSLPRLCPLQFPVQFLCFLPSPCFQSIQWWKRS